MSWRQTKGPVSHPWYLVLYFLLTNSAVLFSLVPSWIPRVLSFSTGLILPLRCTQWFRGAVPFDGPCLTWQPPQINTADTCGKLIMASIKCNRATLLCGPRRQIPVSPSKQNELDLTRESVHHRVQTLNEWHQRALPIILVLEGTQWKYGLKSSKKNPPKNPQPTKWQQLSSLQCASFCVTAQIDWIKWLNMNSTWP